MFLRFRIKQPIFLYSRIKEDLTPSVRFRYKRSAATVVFEGGEAEKASWAEPGERCQWYRKTREMLITLDDSQETGDSELATITSGEHHGDLLNLIFNVTLRVLRVIRNVGIAPEVPETLPSEGDATKQLVKWEPEVSDDGTTWRKLFPVPSLVDERIALGFGILGGAGSPPGFSSDAEFWTGYWDNIKEVLEDNRNPSPEDEFLTNTIGHIRKRNYRLALLEAVIGVEIVLTRFLEAHLAVGKRLPKRRIDQFLQTDLGLTARLAAILDLTVHESYMKKVNLDLVLKAVQWRNRIVHKTGRLPDNIPEEKIREAINAVLDTARTLAEIREDIVAADDKIAIMRRVQSQHPNNRLITIWIKPWHRIFARLQCLSPVPDKAEMESLSQLISDLLKARDPRFDPAMHLHLLFEDLFDKELGRFWLGKLFLPGENPLAPPKRTESSGSTNS